MQMSGHPADLTALAAPGLVYDGNALIFAQGLMEMDASVGSPGVCLGRGAAQKRFPQVLGSSWARGRRGPAHLRKPRTNEP